MRARGRDRVAGRKRFWGLIGSHNVYVVCYKEECVDAAFMVCARALVSVDT